MNMYRSQKSTQTDAIRNRIVGINRCVPRLDGSLRPYINLDNAASTPVLRDVLDTVNHFMEWYSSVHRGTGFKSRVATQAYEDARTTVGRFVGADPKDHIVIFGKNTTEAINKLSYRLALTPEDIVLVSQLEHHSNDLPWRARAQVEHIGVDAQGRINEAHFDQLLAKHARRVKLVAISGGSNVTGDIADIHRLAVKAHAAGAQIMVDCAQLAPHRAVNMGALDDPAQHVGVQGFDVGGGRELGIGHDRGRVRVGQDHPVALLTQHLACLGAGVIELTGLSDHDRTGTDQEDRLDVSALRHGVLQPRGQVRGSRWGPLVWW